MNTVNTHIRNVYAKLHLAQAPRAARHQGTLVLERLVALREPLGLLVHPLEPLEHITQAVVREVVRDALAGAAPQVALAGAEFGMGELQRAERFAPAIAAGTSPMSLTESAWIVRPAPRAVASVARA